MFLAINKKKIFAGVIEDVLITKIFFIYLHTQTRDVLSCEIQIQCKILRTNDHSDRNFPQRKEVVTLLFQVKESKKKLHR